MRLTPDRQSRRGGLWNGVAFMQGQSKLSFEVCSCVSHHGFSSCDVDAFPRFWRLSESLAHPDFT